METDDDYIRTIFDICMGVYTDDDIKVKKSFDHSLVDTYFITFNDVFTVEVNALGDPSFIKSHILKTIETHIKERNLNNLINKL